MTHTRFTRHPAYPFVVIGAALVATVLLAIYNL